MAKSRRGDRARRVPLGQLQPARRHVGLRASATPPSRRPRARDAASCRWSRGRRAGRRSDRATWPPPPRDPATAQAFAGALVARYGPPGSLWAEQPGAAAGCRSATGRSGTSRTTAVLVRRAVRADLRRHAARGRRRASAPPTRARRSARRPAERELARAAPDLQGRRARRVRRRRAAPVHGQAGERDQARAVRARGSWRRYGDGAPPGLDHRAVAGRRRRAARAPAAGSGSRRRRGPGDAAAPGAAAARPRPQARCGSSSVYWYTWLSTPRARTRSTGPACGAAQGRRRVDAGPAGVPDRGAQARGLRKAPGDARRCA